MSRQQQRLPLASDSIVKGKLWTVVLQENPEVIGCKPFPSALVAYSGPGAPRFPIFNWARDIFKTANFNIFSKYIQNMVCNTTYLADANILHKKWVHKDWKRYIDTTVEDNKPLPSPTKRPSRVGDDQPITIYVFVAAIVHMQLVTDAAACDKVLNFTQDQLFVLNDVTHLV